MTDNTSKIHLQTKVSTPLHEQRIRLVLSLNGFQLVHMKENTFVQFPYDAKYVGPRTGLASSGEYRLLSVRPPYAQRSTFRK